MDSLHIVVLGRTLSSALHHRDTDLYRSLLGAMAGRGHRITFLERLQGWAEPARNQESPTYCERHFYGGLEELRDRFPESIRTADLVLVGSGVADGVEINDWVLSEATGLRVFYDLDSPGTLESVGSGSCTYLTGAQASAFDLFLSSTGGPLLGHLERRLGVCSPRSLLPCANPMDYPRPAEPPRYDLGYLGAYAPERHRGVRELLLEPAVQWPEGRFVLAGCGYPEEMRLTPNVKHEGAPAPDELDRFHGSQRFTLITTPHAAAGPGPCPDIRLMKAAARGTTVISAPWNGMSSFFTPGEEILVVRSPRQVLEILRLMPEARRLAIALRARKRVLNEHTPDHRAETLESYLGALPGRRSFHVRRAPVEA